MSDFEELKDRVDVEAIKSKVEGVLPAATELKDKVIAKLDSTASESSEVV